MTTPQRLMGVHLAFIRTKAAVRTSSAELIRLEDDLHDILDRIRVSRQMIEDSRRILDRIDGSRHCERQLAPAMIGRADFSEPMS